MGLFDENIQKGPRVTAQVIRDFQNTIKINKEDPVDVIVDKLCNYMFYWVHTHLLDYYSFKISPQVIIGNCPAWTWDTTRQHKVFNPTIEKVIEELTNRGFEVDILSDNNQIKITWR